VGGLVVPAGGGRKLVTKAQEITFKVTGDQDGFASIFEVVVPPGFDVGAHTHGSAKEFFYILEGELELFAFEPTCRSENSWQDWRSEGGERVVRAGPGSCMFVPAGCPHAFANASDRPARMLFQCYPAPDHEYYFERLAEIFSRGDIVDSDAVNELRKKSDLTQITPLRYQAPRSERPGG
jgi:oxalate decarboxylase/phosphoglucose isomerase-like protein (cupin superfamily)